MRTTKWIVILTIVLELATCWLRFGLDFQTTRDTSFMSAFTFGWRIHHSYIGVLVILTSWSLFRRGPWKTWTWRLGWALLLSDLTHHFLVLWPMTGSPQFDFVY